MMNNALNIGIKNLPASLDPISMRWAHEVMLFQSLYQTLVKLDENGEVVADLATNWKFKDNGTKVTFEIDSQALFANHDPVTPNDVAYSISRHFWPGSDSPVKGLLNDLIVGADNTGNGALPEGITTTARTITFELKAYYFPFLLILSMPSFSILNWHQLSEKKLFLGSGPFAVENLTSKIAYLKKSESYPSKQANVSKLNFVTFEDKKLAIPMLEDGAIDFIFYGVGSATMPTSTKVDLKVTNVDNPIFAHVFTNTNGVLKESVELRRNLFQLLRTFAQNSKEKNVTQMPMETLLPPGFLPHSYYSDRPPAIEPETFVRLNQSFKNLNLNLLASDMINSPEFFEELRLFFLKANIDLTYQYLPMTQFMDTIKRGAVGYDLIFAGYAANIPDPDGIIDPILGLSGWGYGNYDTKEERLAISNAKFLRDPLKRKVKYQQILRKFEDKYLVLPLFREQVQLIYRDQLGTLSTNYSYESQIWQLFWKR